MGMKLLQHGMSYYTASTFTDWLSRHTTNLYKSILIGAIATAVLQSSSVILIITISLVTTKALSFRQTIGIILGANIGTTVTGELLTIGDIFPYHISLLVGLICVLINNQTIFHIGCISLGLSNIFIAMQGFQSFMPIINQSQLLQIGIDYTESHQLIGLITGIIISAIIQSSSATFALTASMLQDGILTFASSFAIILGSNIGTCFTSLLASLQASKQAKLVAITHTIFNVFTVLIVIPFLSLLARMGTLLADQPILQLAHMSVLFNIFSVIIVIPFIRYLDYFVTSKKRIS